MTGCLIVLWSVSLFDFIIRGALRPECFVLTFDYHLYHVLVKLTFLKWFSLQYQTVTVLGAMPLLIWKWLRVSNRGVVIALKRVRVERGSSSEARCPDRGLFRLPWEKPAQRDRRNRPRLSKSAREQTSVVQSITPLYFFLFLYVFWLYLSNLFFNFFVWSGPVR